MYDTPIKKQKKNQNLNKNPLDLLTNELMLIADTCPVLATELLMMI